MSKRMKALLVVSLLLNILMLGIVAGTAGRFLMHTPSRAGWRELAQAFPEDRRPQVEDRLKRSRERMEEDRARIDSVRQEALNALKAEEFDRAAYLARVDRLSALRAESMRNMAEAIADVAEKATPQERAAMAEKLRRSPKGPRRKH